MDDPNRFCPSRPIRTINDADEEATRIQDETGVKLAAFTAVLNETLDRVLLVQLGDYARGNLSGNPWALPGGGVENKELPSVAAVRETKEEVGVTLSPQDLLLAGWFARPYISPTDSPRKGEIIILFAATLSTTTQLFPRRPEIVDAAFFEFSLDNWLQVPDRGTGTHKLQPLRRHWIYWCEIGYRLFNSRSQRPVIWTYRSGEMMSLPPW